MIVDRLLTGAILFSFMTCNQYQEAGRGRPLIDLRIASDTAEAGYKPMRATSDSVFYVDRAHVVSDSDIQSARVFLTNGRFYISARLTRAAYSMYRTVLKRHVGERLAVILDGQLVGAPIIAHQPTDVAPTSDPHLDIAGQVPDSTAQRIKALITARWPADSQ